MHGRRRCLCRCRKAPETTFRSFSPAKPRLLPPLCCHCSSHFPSAAHSQSACLACHVMSTLPPHAFSLTILHEPAIKVYSSASLLARLRVLAPSCSCRCLGADLATMMCEGKEGYACNKKTVWTARFEENRGYRTRLAWRHERRRGAVGVSSRSTCDQAKEIARTDLFPSCLGSLFHQHFFPSPFLVIPSVRQTRR